MIERMSKVGFIRDNFVVRGLENIARSVTLGAALRVSPMLGLAALASLTGCAKVETPTTIVAVKGGSFEDASKEILNNVCGIANPTKDMIAAAQKKLEQANPGAANADEALGWWSEHITASVPDGKQLIRTPLNICAGFGGEVARPATVCPPPTITALPAGEMEQGATVTVDLTNKLTLKNGREKVFVTLADANLGVSILADSIKVTGSNLGFDISAKYNAKIGKHIVDIHDGETVYSMELTVKEKKNTGRTRPAPTGTGTVVPPQPTGIPAAPPKREIPE